MRSFSLIWRNILANPLRSLLTASAIALGIAMLLATSILMDATTRSTSLLVSEQPKIDFQVLRPGEELFSAAVAGNVASVAGVDQVEPSLYLEVETPGLQRKSLQVAGVEAGYAELYGLELANGDFLAQENTIVLPMAFALSEGLRVGESITLFVEGRALNLTVCGRLRLNEGLLASVLNADVAYIRLEEAQALAGAPEQINRLDVGLARGAALDPMQAELLQVVGAGYAVARTRASSSSSLMDVLVQSLLGMVGMMILLAAGFVIFDAFAMAVTDRQKEIASLRCLGSTQRQVLGSTLGEAVYLGLAGAGFGILLGIGLGWAVQQVMGTLGKIPFLVPWWGLVISPFVGLLVTLIAILGPARQAQRVSPLEALRQISQSTSGWYASRAGRVGWIYLAVVMAGLAFFGLVVRPDMILGTVAMVLGILLLGGAFIFLLPSLAMPLANAFRSLAKRAFGVVGGLAVDGLLRNPVRTALTIGGLAIGPAVIIFMSGAMSVLFDNFFAGQSSMIYEDATIGIDYVAALQSGEIGIDNFAEAMFSQAEMNPELLAAIDAAAASDGFELVRYALLRLPSPDLPPMNAVGVAELALYARIGDFDYYEGDREYTLQQMKNGPVILMTPGDAARVGVKLGDKVLFNTDQGSVPFTVAGLGGNNIYMSYIDYADAERYFGLGGPQSVGVVLPPGADEEKIFAHLEEVVAAQPENSFAKLNRDLEEGVAAAGDMLGGLEALLDGLLLLAVVVASLGVINTMTINITERGRELGLLRAVGATRKQVRQSVVGEALVLGIVASLLAAGFGLLIFSTFLMIATPNGYHSMGAVFHWDSLPPALGKMTLAMLISLVITPLVTALTAYIPARYAAALDVIEATRSERLSLKAAPRLEKGKGVRGGVFTRSALRRSTLRTRFVWGVAGLLVVLVLGLTAVIIGHARLRLEETTHETLRMFSIWTAGALEAALPPGAQSLDLDAPAQTEGLKFDEGALLDFEAAFDQMRGIGLVDFSITDADQVILLSMDRKKIGALAPVLRSPDQVDSYSEREEGGWYFYASAPVHGAAPNAAPVLGAVRVVIDAQALQSFLVDLRLTLWGVGALGLLVGMFAAWGLSTPLARGAQQLARHAQETSRGEFTPYPQRRHWLDRFSLQAKLTMILVALILLTTLALALAAQPIEQSYLEEMLKGKLMASARWMGDMASESIGGKSALLDVLPQAGTVAITDLNDYLDQSGLYKLEQLQMLGSKMQNNTLAYIALVDRNGEALISDQLSLVGQYFTAPPDTQVEESAWLDEPVWVISTPIRKGQDGEQLGALRLALRLNGLTDFLNESRILIALAGLIAILAGILLAQALCAALAAPVQQLAAGARQVAQGDFNVQFKADGQDELVLLANAYNNMVAGLQEREWLRDMFGRFVSEEVANAIRSGQVRLEGEHRVVSVLFCDIREFTTRAERQTPEEVLALLNEYLPIVVNAAQQHRGTVNKFGGDSTLVIYGAPHQLQDSAYQAVLTALQVRANLESLNQRLALRDEEPLRIGIGINTGEVVAGAVGPQERQEYTVIGDTVNLASRIEALNKSYPDHDILISQFTYQALGARQSEFDLLNLGDTSIRGKENPVQVWAVRGLSTISTQQRL